MPAVCEPRPLGFKDKGPSGSLARPSAGIAAHPSLAILERANPARQTRDRSSAKSRSRVGSAAASRQLREHPARHRGACIHPGARGRLTATGATRAARSRGRGQLVRRALIAVMTSASAWGERTCPPAAGVIRPNPVSTSPRTLTRARSSSRIRDATREEPMTYACSLSDRDDAPARDRPVGRVSRRSANAESPASRRPVCDGCSDQRLPSSGLPARALRCGITGRPRHEARVLL